MVSKSSAIETDRLSSSGRLMSALQPGVYSRPDSTSRANIVSRNTSTYSNGFKPGRAVWTSSSGRWSSIRYSSDPSRNSGYTIRVPLGTGSAGRKGRSTEVTVIGIRQLGGFNAIGEHDKHVQDAIRKIASSTVLVRGRKGRQNWSGSGVIVDPRDLPINAKRFKRGTYFILTNSHVEGNGSRLTVTLPDGSEAVASLATTKGGAPFKDKIADVALLMIRPGRALPMARIGRSGALRLGETVLAAGHPHGLPKLVVTKGIVTQSSQETGGDLPGIQTDAAINPGNSGGPMFNLKGDVVGLNTYRFGDSDNTAFAQPIDEHMAVLAEIAKRGRVVRGYVPVDFSPFPLMDRREIGFVKERGFPDETGALISWVEPGSAANKAGLKPRDIVTSFDIYKGRRAVSRYDVNLTSPYYLGRLNRIIRSLEPGDSIVLSVYRQKPSGNQTEFKGPFRIKLPIGELTPERLAAANRRSQREKGSDLFS